MGPHLHPRWKSSIQQFVTAPVAPVQDDFRHPRSKSSTQQFMTAHVAPIQDDFRRCKLPLQQKALLPLPHALLSANPIICRMSQHPSWLPLRFKNTVPLYFTLHIQHASPKRLKGTSKLYGVGTPKRRI
jgi:hypothetical protein